MRVFIAIVLMAAAAGCGSSSHQTSPSVAVTDDPACPRLFARLQAVSAAIQGSSDLLANSLDKTQLAGRIADEQAQLGHAAELMAQRPIPAALRSTDRELVTALRAFTADFERAREPAAHGDFAAAAAAMTDRAAVQRIVAGAQAIEDACQ
jgi:hypothetical protein